jgi:two-component system, OmpR family, response regulator
VRRAVDEPPRPDEEAPLRVLVVEDESSVATGVRRALTAEGHAVDLAADGREGLELALHGGYDLIVLDVMLPGMNGYKVCRTLRERGMNAQILMLSAKAGEWDIAEGLDLGADDYLTKPFSTVELLARVRARARGAAGAGAGGTMFTSGDLRLDPSLRRCWRGEVAIELTGRETSLLTALFEQRPRVVTNDELLAAAWGEGRHGDHNVVQVYVGRLRRKVDDPFGSDDIETIRGVGYRLRDRA